MSNQTHKRSMCKDGNHGTCTLRRRRDPGFGPREEKEAINGAGTLTSWDLYITADGDLHSFSQIIKHLVKPRFLFLSFTFFGVE